MLKLRGVRRPGRAGDAHRRVRAPRLIDVQREGLPHTFVHVAVVRDGSFASVGELVEAISTCLAAHNLDPGRCVWRKSGEWILASIRRARHWPAKLM